jgi:hypothetical protein
MNLPAFGKGDLFETEAFCLSGTSPTDKKVLSLGPLCLCGERKQFYALLNMITESALLPWGIQPTCP